MHTANHFGRPRLPTGRTTHTLTLHPVTPRPVEQMPNSAQAAAVTEDLRARSALPPHVAKVGRGGAVGVGTGAGLRVRYCGW